MNRLEQELMYKDSGMEIEEDTMPRGRYLGTINESGLYVALTSFGGHNPCSGSLPSIRDTRFGCDFGLGIGVVNNLGNLGVPELKDYNVLERTRKPETDTRNGDHINVEYFFRKKDETKGEGDFKQNIHIPWELDLITLDPQFVKNIRKIAGLD